MYTAPSGKHYVGRSCNSQDVRAGTNGYGYRNCRAFWNAIQKYGWENFKYEVLETGIQCEDIEVRENYWIEYYHASTDENGYNLIKPLGERKTYTADTRDKLSVSHMGHTPWNKGKTGVYSDDAKKKMSESHKGKNTGENNPRYGKPLPEETKEKLRQYSGERASMWGKHHSAETRQKISEATRGHRALRGAENPMYGKHLSEETRRKMSAKLKGRFAGEKNPMYGVHLTPSEETRKKLSEASSSPVIQYSLDGKYIATFKSQKEAAEAVGGRPSMISACCNGRKKSHKGFQWFNAGTTGDVSAYRSNAKEQAPIVQIKNGEIVHIYAGVNAANRAINKTGSNICACLHGKLKSAYGYQWRYLSEEDLSKNYLQTGT